MWLPDPIGILTARAGARRRDHRRRVGARATKVEVWNTRERLDPGFAQVWEERLARAPHGNFALRLDLLAWEAASGRHALAALVEDGARRGAFVLRQCRGGWVSGWPWRWQAVVEDESPRPPAGLAPDECEWLFEAALGLAAGRQLSFHLPISPPPSPGFAAGATVVRPIASSDDDLLQSLDGDKRRVMKRARKEGIDVIEATTGEQFLAFALLQVETETRRGAKPAPPPSHPAPGESWREWEHPWMKLMVAVRDGRVVAGSGFGWQPGGMIDYRTNASSLEAKKLGANALLAFEAMRRGRDAGARWMNWGGDTVFKRQLGGDPVAVACRLGGGRAWIVSHQVRAMLRRTRPQLAAWWREQARSPGRRPTNGRGRSGEGS